MLEQVFGDPILESNVFVLTGERTWRIGHQLFHPAILAKCIR